MALQVYTARINYTGPDRLDISRKGSDPRGVHFAPSWGLLGPFLGLRKQGIPMTDALWAIYLKGYVKEMHASQLCWPGVWQQLLQEAEVTLCCYCSSTKYCHRFLLGPILAQYGDVLMKGERLQESRQLQLFSL